MPYSLDGTAIRNLAGERSASLALSADCSDITVERVFSNKPRVDGVLVGFANFYDKIESYTTIISGPAMEKYCVNPYTFRIIEHVHEDSVFKFQDTLTSRAEISDLSAKFKDDVVAIIGLGGTGAYILDFLVKTPVKQIRIFDTDEYYVHNAYRSPGRLLDSELGQPKIEVCKSRYDNFRTGISAERKFVDETCKEDFCGVTFAFVCVDKGTSRAGIIELLSSLSIPFVDVGMGLNRKNGKIKGLIRTSYFSTNEDQVKKEMANVPLTDNPENLYKTNIQIAELNALNACLAVIKFKQLRGFYMELIASEDLLFDISDMKIVGSDSSDEQVVKD